MLEILFSFFYIFYITIGMGSIAFRILPIERENIIFTLLTGLFLNLIMASFYAFFYAIDAIFYCINASVATISLIIHRKKIIDLLKNTARIFVAFPNLYKIALLSLLILSLIYSSSMPFLLDNETYYIQTIKWLNAYGIVKGLANLHLFLAQTSGWHILQSSFNFSFVTDRLNDLNGFILIPVFFYNLEKLHLQQQGNTPNCYVAGWGIFIIGIFFFIASPSPDFPLFCIVPIIAQLFFEQFKRETLQGFLLLFILSLLAVLIKVSIAPVLVLPLYLFFRGIGRKRETTLLVVFLCILSLTAFVVKNILLSGYPLYPLSYFGDWVLVDWKLPAEIQEGILSEHISFKEWFSSGLINKLVLFFLIAFPCLVIRKIKSGYGVFYLFLVLQFILLYTTSFQYRFFAPALLCGALAIFSTLKWRFFKKIYWRAFFVNLAILFYVGICGVDFKDVFSNEIMKQKYPFTLRQIITPLPITQYSNLQFSEVSEGNLMYYSPKGKVFFWQTSAGELPCVNEQIVAYFKKRYGVVPQKRGKSMKCGFKAMK